MTETIGNNSARIYGFKGEIKTWNRIAYGAGDMAVNITWAAWECSSFISTLTLR